MDPVTQVAVPLLTVYVMIVVGLELSFESFFKLLRPPQKLLSATLGQTLLLPLVAFAVIALLDPPTHRTLGLIVIAGCPGGVFSNFFTSFSRGDTALSVVLTTACTLISILTLPLVTTLGFVLFAGGSTAVRPPVGQMLGQLVVLLLLPLLLGMTLKSRRPAFFAGIHPRLQRLGMVGIVLLVLWLVVDRLPTFPDELLSGWLTASLFLLPSMALGELVGRALRLPPAERLTYVIELGFRNLGLAILVTVTLLGQDAFLAFAVVFFITTVVYALILTTIVRRRPA